jgi:protein ImuB
LAEAKALLPDALFFPAEPAADQVALSQLALDCQRFSPLVGLEQEDNPECLLSDVTGSTHLWNGETRFLRAVRGYWHSRGYDVQLALASSVGAAWALAHTEGVTLVPPGDQERALAPLPVEALRLPPAVLERLENLGMWSISDVLRLPRETLFSRFGEILPQRLDQALGRLPETFLCERLREPLEAIREWEFPIDDRFALTLVCRQLLQELLSTAGRYRMGLQELAGELKTETGRVTIDIRLVAPTHDDRHLAQLVELQLERQAWSGGVFAVRWTALRLGRSVESQGSWFDDKAEAKKSRAFNTLVDRLTSRLEQGAVLSAVFLPDSQPEHVFRLAPWSSAGPAQPGAFTLPPEQSRGRPFRLLRRPQRIDVASVIPDGPPIRMLWKKQNRQVVRSWGPERIATGWWRAEDVERDYYRIECEDGMQVWIYRDHRNTRWFLHGFFD